MDQGCSHSCSVAVALAARLDGAASPAGRDERLDHRSRSRGAERDDCPATGSMHSIGRNSTCNSGHLEAFLIRPHHGMFRSARPGKASLPHKAGTSSRGDKIRTCDLLVPNQALYQAEPHPDLRIAVSRLNTAQTKLSDSPPRDETDEILLSFRSRQLSTIYQRLAVGARQATSTAAE